MVCCIVLSGDEKRQRWLSFNPMGAVQTALQNELTVNASVAGLYGLGGLEAVVGNVDAALDYLHKALQATNGEVIEWARQGMAWKDLRIHNDLRFRSLVPAID
jgi:hypothetical protein